MTDNVLYKIKMNIYRALGGTATEFDTVEDIENAINEIYESNGGRINIQPLSTDIISNGIYTFNEDGVTGYKPVEVSVNVDTSIAYEDGYNTGYTEGYTQGETTGYNNGYAEGFDGGVADQKSKLESISITENGTYNREDGYNEVKVNVQGKLEVPFEEIGYTTELKDAINNELNNKPLSDLEYSKILYDKWKPGSITAASEYNGDRKLVYCPLIDTSNAKSMNYMFKSCSSLTTIPLLNTSKVISMNYMFNGCSSLTSIPLLDTSKVTNMNYMFYNCSKLTTIPQFDTGNVTSMTSMFDTCTSLTTIPLLDTSSVTSMNYIFGFTELSKLTDLGGFKNLGAQPTLSGTNDNYFLYKAPNITHDSAMNIINNLYDRASAGYSVITLKFATKTLALLSDDDKAIATNKGWIIS